jgi:hypothetical protein
MLNLPGDRSLDGNAPQVAAAADPFAGQTALSTNGAGAPTAGTSASGGTSTMPSGWGSTPTATSQNVAAAPSGQTAKDRAIVVLAWVLLFASTAGNIYLFWSYLDVRTKYRALVRKTARAVGSRFAAA